MGFFSALFGGDKDSLGDRWRKIFLDMGFSEEEAYDHTRKLANSIVDYDLIAYGYIVKHKLVPKDEIKRCTQCTHYFNGPHDECLCPACRKEVN